MKKLLLIFVACVMGLTTLAQKGSQIEGTIKDIKEGDVSLSIYPENGKEIQTLNVKIVNGKFSFTGIKTVKNPVPAELFVNGTRRGIPFFFDGSKVTITIDSIATGKVKIIGSKANDQYNALIANCSKEGDEDKYMDCFMELIRQNSSSVFTPYIVAKQMIYYLDYDQLDKVLKSLSGDALNAFHYKTLSNDRDQLEKVSIGKKASKIQQNDTAGISRSFDELLQNNQYVLIDFWASWCGPCRRENPNIVEAYKAYHNKGFDIFAVSFDTDKARWEKAIAADNLSWTHVSELNGFKNSAAEDFFIKGIPANVLIDKNGIIVARNLHGKELQDKLKELLDK